MEVRSSDAGVHVVLGQVLAQVLAFDLEAMARLVLGGALDHGPQRGRGVEVGGPHGVGVGDDRIGRVAVHLRLVPAHDGPLGQPAVLAGVVDQRLHHVAGGRGIEQADQLHLAPVDVPLREVGVLGAVPGVHFLRVTAVAVVVAVVVRDDVGEEEGVVERGVEGVLLGRRAPGGVDAAQDLVPAGRGLVGHVGERPARILGREVGRGVGRADERQGDLHGDCAGGGWGSRCRS